MMAVRQQVDRGNGAGEKLGVVENLGRRFGEFRRTSRAHSWVPRELRDAVVSAMREGVAPAQLRSACGVSTSQLGRWWAASQAGNTLGAAEPNARVFSVMDAPVSQADAAGSKPEVLELRVGPWAVQVQLAREGEPRRG